MPISRPGAIQRFWVKALYLSLIILTWQSLPANAQDTGSKPTVIWYGANWVPAWILDGPDKGTGYADRMQLAVQQALPEFHHENKWTSLPRVNRALMGQENVCFASGFYNWINPATGEPFEEVIWSAPVYLFYWHGLAVLSEKRHLFPPDGQVRFADVIKDQNLKLGLVRGRSYGANLDPILKSQEGADHILVTGSDRDEESLQYKLLIRGRVDYLLDYSFNVTFATKRLNEPGRFTFIPIEDHPQRYGIGAINCNNSAQGRQVITLLNKKLQSLRKRDDFKAISKDWFMLHGREDEFDQLWETVLLPKSE